MSITISKFCSAGRDHAALKSGHGWSSLEHVGVQRVPAGDDGPAYMLVLANCPCGSTLGREFADAADTIVIDPDNYDGPPDGEAWSGGFADNH